MPDDCILQLLVFDDGGAVEVVVDDAADASNRQDNDFQPTLHHRLIQTSCSCNQLIRYHQVPGTRNYCVIQLSERIQKFRYNIQYLVRWILQYLVWYQVSVSSAKRSAFSGFSDYYRYTTC